MNWFLNSMSDENLFYTSGHTKHRKVHKVQQGRHKVPQGRHKVPQGLHQGLSEPESNGDLVYKFKKIIGRTDFPDQFRKPIIRHKRINVMRQSA